MNAAAAVVEVTAGFDRAGKPVLVKQPLQTGRPGQPAETSFSAAKVVMMVR